MTRVVIAAHESSARSALVALSDRIHLIDLNAADPAPSDFVLSWKRRALACGALIQRVERIGAIMDDYGVVPNDVALDHNLNPSLDDIQTALERAERDLAHHTDVLDQLDADVERLCEKLLVQSFYRSLTMAGLDAATFSEMEMVHLQDEVRLPLRHDTDARSAESKRLRCVCGCIGLADRATFERMIYRVSRGNAHVLFELDTRIQIDDVRRTLLATGKRRHRPRSPPRVAFCVFAVGRQMELKVRHLVSLMGTLHELDDSTDALATQQAIIDEVRDTIGVMQATAVQVTSLLQALAAAPYRTWSVSLKRTLALAVAMQSVRPIPYMGAQTLQIAGWVHDLDAVRAALAPPAPLRSGGGPGAVLHEVQRGGPGAPTHFPKNALLGVFQRMVDTYGTPRYREVNPAVFTVITFPFMFGQMFGDVGHGALLLIVAVFVFIGGSRLPTLMTSLHRFRYLVLLMAVFSIYCGAIYNEIFGWNLSLWPSAWTEFQGDLVQIGVYPLGVDPAWHGSDYELAFLNSVKMKLAVVFGVVHMMVGIILGAFNHREFQDRYALRYEFVPELLFLSTTFGYMALLIIIKACYDWRDDPPPSIIQTMIGLFVGGTYTPMFIGQWFVHGILRLVAVSCVPVMLLGGPLARWRDRNAAGGRYKRIERRPDESELIESHAAVDLSFSTEEQASPHAMSESIHPENLIEDLLHRGIHTIEFVLGAVSNTASYLRLWALSLAHQQLALVFLERLLLPGLSSSNVFVQVIGLGFWASATVGVLCGMDAFECLLHALRLHWVEFQSKFYHADGIAWRPFSLTDFDLDPS